MALFAVTAFVIFRFGLDRTSLSGSLAAGVLWVTLLFAAVLGINRLFVAEREEGGFDAIRLAPIDRTVLFAAKAAALLVYLRVLELIAVPVFALFFLGSAAGLAPLVAVLVLADLGLAATGTLISSMAVNSRARDLLVPLVLLPLVVPLMIAATGATDPLLAAGGPGYHRFGTWLASPRPIRSDLPPGRIRGLRLPPGGLSRAAADREKPMYGKGLRTLSISDRGGNRRGSRRWSSSTRRSTPTRASSRRSSTCTCRSRSSALVGFMIGGIFAHRPPAQRQPSSWDAYSYVSIHMSVIFGVAVLITGAIWAKASWGHWWVWDEPTLVSFLIVFLLYATYYPFRYAIEDPRAPGPLRLGLRDHRAAPSCRSTSSPCGWRRASSTRGSSPPPTAACPAR